ncbi:MAG: cytosine permease [Micavibrio sp.]|nr:cytosine permease [Micavibrio sp.]
MVDKILQDFTHSAVPDEHAKLKIFYLTSLELSVAICVPVFVFGAKLGSGMELQKLAIALALSGLVLGAIGAFISYVGIKTRLSTGLLAQSVFGSRGAKFVHLVLAVSLFAWFGLQTEVFAKAVIRLFYHLNVGWIPPETATLVAAGLLMTLTSILGLRKIGRLAIIATPLLLLAMLYAVWQSRHGTDLYINRALEEYDPMTFGTAIASIIGAYSVGLVVRPDIQRFAFSARHGVGSALLSLGLGYPLLLLLSAYLANVTGDDDFTNLLITYGFGSFSLVMLLIAAWMANDMNLYSSSLSLAKLFHGLPRWALTAIAGIVGTILSLFGLFEHVVALFGLMGILTTPLLAAYCAKFIAERHHIVPHIDRVGIHIPPFVIWILSSLVGFLTTATSEWGAGLFQLTTVPPLDSLIVATVLMSGYVYWQKRREKSEESV